MAFDRPIADVGERFSQAVMFDFVWHLRGSVALADAITNEAALSGVARLLADQGKPISRRSSASVCFEAPILGALAPGWRAMVIYERGRFWIEETPAGRRLRYDLRCLHALAICLLFALIAFAFAASQGGIPRGLAVAALAFGWFYGMNVLLALMRVPQAIRSAVQSP